MIGSTPKLKAQLKKLINRLGGDVALSVKFLTSKETIEINQSKQFWAASVIKIPIACVFFRQVKLGTLKLTDKTKISPENLVEGTGVVKILDTQNEYTLLDLVKLILVLSDNTATNQIVDTVGWENIEKYMRELGLTSTTFKHKMMIKAGRGPNLTTSQDIAMLLEKLYNQELPYSQEITDILKHQYDRTRIPSLLPNDVETAHKPGSLPEAMHDVGIIYSLNPFIFVFLSDNQKDKRLTNDILAKCTLHCYNYSELR